MREADSKKFRPLFFHDPDMNLQTGALLNYFAESNILKLNFSVNLVSFNIILKSPRLIFHPALPARLSVPA
jgi:hypothetical protein